MTDERRIINRAARKSRYRDDSEYRDFGRMPRFLAIAVILHHDLDYRRTTHKIGMVAVRKKSELLFRH